MAGSAVAGPLTVADGVALIGLFVLFVAYVAVRELRRDVAVFRDAEVVEAAAVGGPGGGPPRPSRGGGGGAAPGGGPPRPPGGGGDARDDDGLERQILDDMPFASGRELPGW